MGKKSDNKKYVTMDVDALREQFDSFDKDGSGFLEAGEPVPRYLIPPSHPLHIPPHVPDRRGVSSTGVGSLAPSQVVAYDLQHRLEKGAFNP